jgi:hypothetical protein
MAAILLLFDHIFVAGGRAFCDAAFHFLDM